MSDWNDIEPGDVVVLAHPDCGNIRTVAVGGLRSEPRLALAGFPEAIISDLSGNGWRIDRVDKGAAAAAVAISSNGVHDDTQPWPVIR